jgi:hypothetical protein
MILFVMWNSSWSLLGRYLYLRDRGTRTGHAVAQAVSRWLPTVAARVRVRAACGVCGRQSGWGRCSPSTSVSTANHSTNLSIIIITRSGHNRPICGRSAERTQLDSTPPQLYQLKKHGHPTPCELQRGLTAVNS